MSCSSIPILPRLKVRSQKTIFSELFVHKEVVLRSYSSVLLHVGHRAILVNPPRVPSVALVQANDAPNSAFWWIISGYKAQKRMVWLESSAWYVMGKWNSCGVTDHGMAYVDRRRISG